MNQVCTTRATVTGCRASESLLDVNHLSLNTCRSSTLSSLPLLRRDRHAADFPLSTLPVKSAKPSSLPAQGWVREGDS